MIFEDDVDWDLHIHEQLQTFASARRRLSDIADDAKTRSPYGDDWDLLWLGHCKHTFDAKKNDTISYTDPTLPAPEFLTANLGDWKSFPSRTRYIQDTGDNCCSVAYAVTLEGARKLLHWLTSPNMIYPFDISLNGVCSGRQHRLRCQSLLPPLFHQHFFAGPAYRTSDIHAIQDKVLDESIQERGYMGAVRFSTRLNMDRIFDGQGPLDQFEDKPAEQA